MNKGDLFRCIQFYSKNRNGGTVDPKVSRSKRAMHARGRTTFHSGKETEFHVIVRH